MNRAFSPGFFFCRGHAPVYKFALVEEDSPNMKVFFRLVALTVVLATLVVGIASAQEDRTGWPTTMSLGLFGGDDSAEALRENEPLRAYLAERLGIDVLITTGTSYSAVIEAMRADRVDAMFVGPLAFVIAERVAGAEPLVVVAQEGFGDITELPTEVNPPFYFSVFVTKKGSGIASLADLEGQDVAFVDPASTSGRGAPVVALLNNVDGLETAADVDAWLNPIFAGTHQSAISALWSDQVVAATTFEGNLINMRDEGLINLCGFEDSRTGVILTQEQIDAIYNDCPEGNLVVIAQTAPIPNTPVAVRGNLPESFKMALRDALLDITGDLETLKAIGYFFVDPTTIESLNLDSVSDFYEVVRQIADVVAQ
jgi:phosphonate transport system substrate-binding protein